MSSQVDLTELLPLEALAKLLPRNGSGKRVAASTVFRRIHDGVQTKDGSTIRLRAVRDGRRLLSCLAWWREFCQEVRNADERATVKPESGRSRRRTSERYRRADAMARAEGI